MGWCHGFKLHLLYNDCGEITTFCLITSNVSDKDRRVWAVLGKKIYGKLFADRGYISQPLFDTVFADGVHLVTGIKANMRNRLMLLWDKIILRKRYIIEYINEMLKTTGKPVHTRPRSLNNLIMNLIAALGAYCFYDNKPQAIQRYHIEDDKLLTLF